MRKSEKRSSFCVEALEPRQLLSSGPAPVIVVGFGGTVLSYQSILFGTGGHGIDPDFTRDMSVADRMTKSWNPASKTFYFNWGTIGNANAEGDTASQMVLQYLASHASQNYILIVIGYSQGAYPANELINKVVRGANNLVHTNFIELDPTGIKALNEGQLAPLVWGGRVYNTTYFDGLHPFGPLAVSEYPEGGTMIQVLPTDASGNPITDPLKAHEAFPAWFSRGLGNSVEANLILSILGADAYKTSTARLAANTWSDSPDVTNPIYIAGSGPPLAWDVLESAFRSGVTQLADDIGDVVALAADKAGDLVVTTLESPGKYISAAFNSVGNIVHTVENDASSLVKAVDDAVGFVDGLLGGIFGWL